MNDHNLLNIVTTGETRVKSARGVLHAIVLNKPAGAALTIFDSTSMTGTKIATIAASTAAGTLAYEGRFMNGLSILNGDAVRASAVLTSDTTNPSVDDTVTIGTGDNERVYRFKSTMLAAYDVKIGANTDATLTNLAAAINGTATAAQAFAGTLVHPDVTSSAPAANAITVTANLYGTSGNAIAKAESSTHLDWDGAGAVFTAGAEGTAFDLTVSYN